MRDLMRHITVEPAILPVVIGDNTPAVGLIINRQGCESLTFQFMTGVIVTGAATFAVSMVESDDPAMATSNPVAEQDLHSAQRGVAALTAASWDGNADSRVMRVGYCGNKQYVRCTVTPAGNAAACPLAAVAIKGHFAQQPT